MERSRLINFIFLFETEYELLTTENREEVTSSFKLAIAFIACFCEEIWPVVDPKNLRKLLDMISFSEQCRLDNVRKSLSMKIDIENICASLRECCEDMLRDTSCKLTRHPLLFVLMDWAYLDERDSFFKIPKYFQITEVFFRDCKPYCKSLASVTHLLMFAKSSGIQKHLSENWELPLQVALACSKQLFITDANITDALLHLIRSLFKQTELWSETEESFYSVHTFLQSLLNIHIFDPFAKKSVNKLLHTSLDILADFERVSGSECSDITNKFCEVCASLVEKVNGGRKSWLEIDVFYWANLLCYREGHSHATMQFVDGSLKNLFLRQLTEASGFSIPHCCLELPKIVQNLKSQRYNIQSFSNLQTAFDEALVHSLLKLVDENSITESKGIEHIEKFVLQVDKRPLAMEAFSKVVLEKFPVVTSNTATVEAALKILEFPPTLIMLELIRRENKTTISQFSFFTATNFCCVSVRFFSAS